MKIENNNEKNIWLLSQVYFSLASYFEFSHVSEQKFKKSNFNRAAIFYARIR